MAGLGNKPKTGREASMETQSFLKTWPTHFDASGRVLVPAELRKELHAEVGTPAIWSKIEGGVVLKRYEDVIAEVQQHFCSIGCPDDIWSEELIQSRRAEARLE